MIGKESTSDRGVRKLLVWQKAHQLALLIYRLAEKFPRREMFGLTSQLCRVVVSVPANIAEGYAAGGGGQFKRYLNVAQGSLAEVEYYLILAKDLNYLSSDIYQESESLRSEVGFLLHRLIKSVDQKA